MNHLATALLALSLASLASGGPQDGDVLAFPAPSGPLELHQGQSLADVVAAYASSTGQAVIFSTEAKGYLESIEVPLTEPLTVPEADVHTVFETLLVETDFVLTVASASTSNRILAITCLMTGDRNTVRGKAAFVDVDRIEEFARHPALLLTTTVRLPNTDVRQLSNSLRTMMTDANTQQILPAGNTNTMVLTGLGSELARTIKYMRTIDEAAAIDGVVRPDATMTPGARRSSAIPPELQFPLASGPLEIPPNGGSDSAYSVDDLARDYAALTGQTITYRPETARALVETPLLFTDGRTVARENVQRVVESLLAANDFLLVVVSTRPRILELISMSTGQRNTLRARVLHVDAEQAELLEAHPAMLFSTVVHTERIDVRQYSNSMRTMIVDANTSQLLPAGNTSSLVLTGLGPWVAGMARMTRSVDAAAAEHVDDAPAAEKVGDGE